MHLQIPTWAYVAAWPDHRFCVYNIATLGDADSSLEKNLKVVERREYTNPLIAMMISTTHVKLKNIQPVRG